VTWRDVKPEIHKTIGENRCEEFDSGYGTNNSPLGPTGAQAHPLLLQARDGGITFQSPCLAGAYNYLAHPLAPTMVFHPPVGSVFIHPGLIAAAQAQYSRVSSSSVTPSAAAQVRLSDIIYNC